MGILQNSAIGLLYYIFVPLLELHCNSSPVLLNELYASLLNEKKDLWKTLKKF